MSGRLVRLDGEVGHAAAAGYGQVLFAESPLGGLLMLLGLIPLAPRAAVGAAIACTLATVLARLRGYPYAEWRRGLYGYVAALTGVFWGVLFAPTLVLLALAVAPFVDRNPSTKPGDRKIAITLFTMLLMFGAVLTIIGSFFRGTGYNWVWPWAQGVFFEL